MSDFSKDSVHKAMDAAAYVAINRFMQQETAENLRNLRASLEKEDNELKSGV